MSQSLLAKLDELQEKVLLLANALEHSRTEVKRARESSVALTKDNEQLKKQVAQAQTQVNEMIHQWFPELELNTENEIGST